MLPDVSPLGATGERRSGPPSCASAEWQNGTTIPPFAQLVQRKSDTDISKTAEFEYPEISSPLSVREDGGCKLGPAIRTLSLTKH
jgi:hypothetical protein